MNSLFKPAGFSAIAPALAGLLFLLVLPINHTAALRHLLLFVLFLLAIKSAFKSSSFDFPARLPLFAWAGLALLSTLWSQNPAFTLREVQIEIVLGLLTFYSFYTLTSNQNRLRMYIAGLLMGLALTALIRSYELIGVPAHLYEWDWQHGVGSYSTYLALTWPVLLYCVFFAGGYLRLFAAALIPVMLWMAVATRNRMLLLVIIVITVTGAVLWYAPRRSQMRHRNLLLAALFSATAILIWQFLVVLSKRPINAVYSAGAAKDSSFLAIVTESERFQIWSFWIQKIPEHLFLGVGFGRDLPHMVYEKPAEWIDLMFAHGHNVFIDTTLQLGLLGLMVFLWLMLAFGRFFLALWRNKEVHHAAGWLGLMVMFAMLLKNSTDDFFWRTDALLFWALMGMLASRGARELPGTTGKTA